jgi:TolB-like protein/class 3 adenylate cyclase/Tfp pilus assembly protein PilF
MSAEVKKKIELEIAHVLFLDIVGYSKLSVNEQHGRVDELNGIVRLSEQYQKAEAANRILKIPTGDGMALVFYKSPEEPAQCAFEISRALKANQRLQVRMGIHSGPVSGVVDVNERTNVAGAGINLAQRVMDCGDAGHILLSHHVAEDLAEYEEWRPFLHDIGTFEVKHGARVNVTNLYSDEVGNPNLPSKLQAINQALRKHRSHVRWVAVAIALLLLAAVAGAFVYVLRKGPTRSLATAVEKSIAVLPFENLSEEKANAFFTEGVQDEILTHLARIADLKVISRTSVMQYKSGAPRNLREIGQQLGVAHVVEGSVQRAANKVRVIVQLIDARNDAHLWAQTYDRDLADVFAIQSEIAKAIADQLQAKLSPNEKKAIEQPPTTDLAAFELYSRAKSLLLTANFSATIDSDLQKAIELLDEAVKRDPSFFDAYCQLAFAHEQLYATRGSDHTPARLALAEAAVQAATRLRPDAAETHLARAQYLYYGPRDYAGALAELEIARRALPNDPRLFELTGYILRRRGQQEEGLRNLELAVELDPRNFFTLQQIALSYQFLGRYAEAIAALDRALAIVPDNAETRATRGSFYIFWKGDIQPLHQTIDAILAQGPSAIASAADTWFACALAERDPAAAERALFALGDNDCWNEGAINLSRSFGEGLLARMTKDEARARTAFEAARAQQEKIVQAQPDYGPTLCVLGLIDAALGRKDLALDEGRRAIALMPVEKDIYNGSLVLQYFAITAAWAGEKELALQQLEAGLRTPAAALMLSYGALKLFPFWDPLRGDPRFEKIVASLAPRE